MFRQFDRFFPALAVWFVCSLLAVGGGVAVASGTEGGPPSDAAPTRVAPTDLASWEDSTTHDEEATGAASAVAARTSNATTTENGTTDGTSTTDDTTGGTPTTDSTPTADGGTTTDATTTESGTTDTAPTTDDTTAASETETTATARQNGRSTLVVAGLDAPERVRRGATFAVTATVTNRGEGAGTDPVGYAFGGETVSSRDVSLAAGASQNVTFELSTDDLGTGNESAAVGTYVHGVRNESGAGVARRIRVSPDVDLRVEEFDAPVEISRGGSFVVLATVSNPADISVTRRVAYRFEGETVADKTLTVAGGEREQVAFAVDTAAIAAAGVELGNGTTYDHAVVADGGERDGDAARIVAGPSGDASALAVEEFRAADDLREEGRVYANITVRNVDTVPFEGQLAYRLDGSVVTTDRVEVPVGERRTVRFVADYAAVERAAVPVSSRNTDHGVWVGNDSLARRPLTVEAPVSTPATTAAATPAFTATTTATTEAVTTSERTGTVSTTTPTTCERGFFARCGGTVFGQTTLTLIGILTSAFGIVYEMLQGS
ncbi:hypothetical protein [Halorussus salinus]|uniref:hypothetical protein n=1 Tax=Halorussus salinus TaxID=1364935 RepID=UPI00109321BE|nr:hypothetical protein [Halorussus salinus]